MAFLTVFVALKIAHHALPPKTQVIKVANGFSFIADSGRAHRGASIALFILPQSPTEPNGHLRYGGGRGPGMD